MHVGAHCGAGVVVVVVVEGWQRATWQVFSHASHWLGCCSQTGAHCWTQLQLVESMFRSAGEDTLTNAQLSWMHIAQWEGVRDVPSSDRKLGSMSDGTAVHTASTWALWDTRWHRRTGSWSTTETEKLPARRRGWVRRPQWDSAAARPLRRETTEREHSKHMHNLTQNTKGATVKLNLWAFT